MICYLMFGSLRNRVWSDAYDTDAWNTHFPTFRKQIVKRSLRWPTAKSLQNIGIRKTFNHPRNLAEMTKSDEEFKNWGRRFRDILESLY